MSSGHHHHIVDSNLIKLKSAINKPLTFLLVCNRRNLDWAGKTLAGYEFVTRIWMGRSDCLAHCNQLRPTGTLKIRKKKKNSSYAFEQYNIEAGLWANPNQHNPTLPFVVDDQSPQGFEVCTLGYQIDLGFSSQDEHLISMYSTHLYLVINIKLCL